LRYPVNMITWTEITYVQARAQRSDQGTLWIRHGMSHFTALLLREGVYPAGRKAFPFLETGSGLTPIRCTGSYSVNNIPAMQPARPLLHTCMAARHPLPEWSRDNGFRPTQVRRSSRADARRDAKKGAGTLPGDITQEYLDGSDDQVPSRARAHPLPPARENAMTWLCC